MPEAPDELFAEIEQEKRRKFLSCYSELGNVGKAATAAGISRGTHYVWLNDPKYAEAFAKAERLSATVLEEEAKRRAFEGVEDPVIYRGVNTGLSVRKYSDILLIFLLKGLMPDRYREKHVGGDGNQVTVVVDRSQAEPQVTVEGE